MTVAFFPGKFSPPHLGHILTIMNVYDEYDRIIVGITEGPPRVNTKEEAYVILNQVFRKLQKIELRLIEGTMDDGSAMNNLPDEWDILLTGNPLVIDIARANRWNYRYVPRSKGIGYSGTELRKLYEMESNTD